MEIKTSLKYFRVSPRKARLVADLVRGMSYKNAERQLEFLDKKSAAPVLKLLRSAKANAENNFNISDVDSLRIKEIKVDEGPHIFKRWRPRSMGRANQIIKRISHINLILEADVKAEDVKKKKTEIEDISLKKTKSEGRPKIVKEKAQSISKSTKEGSKEEQAMSDKYTDKGSVPQKPHGSSGDAKKKSFSKQWTGSLNKRFFRRKSA